MSYFGELQAAGRSPRVCHFLILCLLSYIFIDYVLHHSGTSSCVDLVFDASDAKVAKSDKESVADSAQEDPICGSVIGHLNSGQEPLVAKAWSQMKWIGAPAKCRVKGQLIEALDPRNNFRRGFSLKFTSDVEDKTAILPWLYGAKVDLNKRARRVYLDLGANSFRTSVTWFSQMYPCDFTEIHAFEVSPQLFKIPSSGFNEETNWVPENSHATRVKTAPGVPNWMLDRIKTYNTFVSDGDDEKSTNITRFIKEDLQLTADDAVVVKMDIEGAEWPILKRWLLDLEMANIIDELFVEIHYRHNTMLDYHWGQFSHSREEATRLIASLRAKGYFIHAWP
ncbi:uncharacterized protein [Physcomitrium patens]|uniref:Methyltransferase FkbM domain-containing protein n=1 Tax=Physcomitrium patens TaxID=3218 RepID=A9TNY7_PHYPA|nr:uncharacterized protein LOC112278488 [Physcomitrium patens]PNR26386.1 hypothetical protein PHYPA_030961 [Physcomitrium patens]|eukprot:XP_024367822.1 uncharacterized protein LOC112278488 [Physcomitrella patens]